MGDEYFPEGSDSEQGSGNDNNDEATQDMPSGRPAGQGPHPGGDGEGGSGLPPMPQQWLALIASNPKWETKIKTWYAQAWQAGKNMNKAYDQLVKIMEKQRNAKKEGKGAEEASPWESTISNSYFDIWGEDIPDSELEYAKSEGMNAYEFVQYQRSKTAFTETPLFEHESTGLAGTLANIFGFGGNFSGSMSPIKGSGAYSQ